MSHDFAPSAPTRRQELDVLRGMLLVLMTLTHLPTRLSTYSNQPFGFVSAAEAFVFLSAFLVGSTYARKHEEKGARYVRVKLLRRAGKLYLAHVGLLVFLFTVVAALAASLARPQLHNHLAIFFTSPAWAVLASPILLYEPPLLDVLPMYVAFLAATPMLLALASRRGWRPIICVSVLLWLLAQFGARRLIFNQLAQRIGFPLPIEALGAFDWLAWQLIWVAGVWLGARSLHQSAVARSAVRERALLGAAALSAALLLVARYNGAFGIELGPGLLSKWHLGTLRIVNFAALGYFVAHAVLPYLRLLDLRLLALLGRSSLPVFTAHVPLCVLSRALIADDTVPLTLAQQAGVLIATFAVMVFVAWRADSTGSNARGSSRRAAQAV